MSDDLLESTRQYVRENRETLVRILQHGDDEFARACAWALLDEAGETPDLDELVFPWLRKACATNLTVSK